jgi:hypothetical protein
VATAQGGSALGGGAGGLLSAQDSPQQDDTAATAAAAAAVAAAAAAEALSQEHWQAAALTYDFDSSQLQVLVGQPDALLKLLKQQAEALEDQAQAAAATAAFAANAQNSTAATAASSHTSSSSSSSRGPGQQQHPPDTQQQQQQQTQHQQRSRTGTPTPDALGYDVPALPPAPSGVLADSIAAAQAAGIRVLACQLRGLNPDEPLVMRLLLDYSILEVFFGTGEGGPKGATTCNVM